MYQLLTKDKQKRIISLFVIIGILFILFFLTNITFGSVSIPIKSVFKCFIWIGY